MNTKKIKVQVNADLADIMPIFMKRMNTDMVAMIEMIGKKDFEGIVRFAHRLRGNGPCYGIMELGVLGTDLEMAAKSNNIEICEKLFHKVEAYMEQIEIEFVQIKE